MSRISSGAIVRRLLTSLSLRPCSIRNSTCSSRRDSVDERRDPGPCSVRRHADRGDVRFTRMSSLPKRPAAHSPKQPAGSKSRRKEPPVGTVRRGISGITAAAPTNSRCGSKAAARAGTRRCAMSKDARRSQPEARRATAAEQRICSISSARAIRCATSASCCCRTVPATCTSAGARSNIGDPTERASVRSRRRAQHASPRSTGLKSRGFRSAHAVRQRRKRRRGGRRVLGGGDRRSLAASAIDRARRFRRRIPVVGRERGAARNGACSTRCRSFRRTPNAIACTSSRSTSPPRNAIRTRGSAQVNFADDAAQRRFMSLLGTPVKQLTKPLTCNLNEVRIDAPGIPQLHLSGQAARDTANRRRLLDALRRPESRRAGWTICSRADRSRTAGATARRPVARKPGHAAGQMRHGL